MSNIIIDGVEYDVAITECKRKADILDKYAERTEDGNLHREVIGTYHNFTLNLFTNDKALYNKLFDVLSAPVAKHSVTMPTDGVTFDGYFASVQDEVVRIEKDGTKYKGLSCNLVAVYPRRRAGSDGILE